MAELEIIYNAYNEITDAGDNAPQHVEAYSHIIAGTQGTEGTKRLAAQFIPAFFKHFPALHSRAIDGVFDLCEDEITLVRQAAIKSLPSLCRDGPQHTIKIADVLCQLLQLDGEDLAIVQGALQTLLEQSPREVLAVLFTQGIKGELRGKTLSFINNQVVSSFQTKLSEDPEIEGFFVEEIRKTISSVSDSELEAFAKIIMQTKLYQNGDLDLAGFSHIYIAHITSEIPWNINNPELIKRVLLAGRLSMPLFQRNISADPLLKFFATNILPHSEFKQLMDDQRAKVLKLYTDSITTGHPSPAVLSRAGGLVGDLLVTIDLSKPAGFVQVEFLLFVLNLFIRDTDLLKRADLVARFRDLYSSTQTELTKSKKLSSKVSQDPDQAAEVKKLTRTRAILNNIHTLVAEFLKPETHRTQLALHPSWKPVPEPTQPLESKTAGLPKPASRNTLTLPTRPIAKPATRSTAKSATQPNTSFGSKPTPQQQQQQPFQSQHQQGASNKRKADPESNTHQKKPKITRPHGSSAVGLAPGNSSLGGQDPKGAKQLQTRLDVHAQVQAQLQARAELQTRAKAGAEAKAQAQTQAQAQQHQHKRQLQMQQPPTLRGHHSARGSAVVPHTSSPRAAHGSQQQGKKGGHRGFGGGVEAGWSKRGGLTSPSLMDRPPRRRDTNDRINFLQRR
ncbi:MAG: apoptosis inhibitory protein 5-domain-containing protein [Linnemannia gamsii]|nr:MAG: apoptosis inhibitory protein 5-domain-containing protein [Linnemannia gamsii]